MKSLKFEAIKDNEDNVYNDLEENLGAEEENININPPTEEEIKQVLKETNNWKATGSDKSLQRLCSTRNISPKILKPLFNKTWCDDFMPQDWKKLLFCKLPKKRDLIKY